MTMALYQLPLTSLGGVNASVSPNVPIAGITLPEAIVEFSADFAPANGDFLLPSTVREGWSSVGGNDVYLVPVYSGDE